MSFTKVSLTGTRDTIRAAFTRFNTFIDDLLAVTSGKGASQVGLEDSAGDWDAVNLETLAAEIADDLTAPKALSDVFAENPDTTTGLTWGYKAGKIRVDNVITTIAVGTVGLTDNATNYIEIDSAGTVHKNTTGYTSGRIPIRTIVTLAGEIVTSTDMRAWFVTIATASATVKGISELAIKAEGLAGEDTGRVIVPDILAYVLQAGTMQYVADTAANDTYVATMVPAIDAYADGMVVNFKAKTANTGAATLNVNAKGAKAIKKHHDQDLATGDIEAGQIVTVVYDGTNFQMQSQVGATTGAGAAVKAVNPALVTPALGTPQSGTLTNCDGYPIPIENLKPVVNGDVNKLDIFSKSGGAAFDATDYLTVSIPDGTGYTSRTRAAAVASGTGQIILADAANYWSKGTLAAEIKTAYLYAIWSAADGGIVFALNGYSGFTRCPASVTATDDDYMHLEASSSYTPVITDYCVAIAKIRYEYDTGDAPDHTIQATALDAPQVCWNPKSDYGYQKNLATTVTSESNIAEYSAVSVVVKQSGKYVLSGQGGASGETDYTKVITNLKTGSSTYASAVYKAYGRSEVYASNSYISSSVGAIVYLNAGDTIHLGETVITSSATRILLGDNTSIGATSLRFKRID